MKFRRGVYANRGRITPMCQVLLLRLSDDMDDKCIVSIPRSQLAEEFGCPLSRVTEWMNKCRSAGFLSTVRRGRPGVTAVYQGLFVGTDEVREGVPTEVRQNVPSTRYADSDHVGVREGVPQNGATRYALPHTQEVVRELHIDGRRSDHPERRGHDEASA